MEIHGEGSCLFCGHSVAPGDDSWHLDLDIMRKATFMFDLEAQDAWRRGD